MQLVKNVTWKIASSFLAILILSGIPYLFDGLKPNFPAYFKKILDLCVQLTNVSEMTYMTGNNISRPLIPAILLPLSNSYILLFGALLITIALSFLFAVAIIQLNKKRIALFKEMFIYIQAIPDIFYIISFQIIILTIYKKTDIMVFNFVSYGDVQARFLPTLALAIVPTMLLTRLMINLFIEETFKNYVEFAQSKGLHFLYILLHHIFPNVIFSLFHYSKTIILFLLTNLFVVEYLFNVNGVMFFLLKYHYPEVFLMSLITLYFPLLILFQLYEIFVPKIIKRGVGS